MDRDMRDGKQVDDTGDYLPRSTTHCSQHANLSPGQELPSTSYPDTFLGDSEDQEAENLIRSQASLARQGSNVRFCRVSSCVSSEADPASVQAGASFGDLLHRPVSIKPHDRPVSTKAPDLRRTYPPDRGTEYGIDAVP